MKFRTGVLVLIMITVFGINFLLNIVSTLFIKLLKIRIAKLRLYKKKNLHIVNKKGENQRFSPDKFNLPFPIYRFYFVC